MRTFLTSYDDICMMKISSLILILFSLISLDLRAQDDNKTINIAPEKISDKALVNWCVESLNSYKGYKKNSNLLRACENVLQMKGCTSVSGKPIFHLDQKGRKATAKNILVISLIHGDEIGAGALGRYWFERVQEIDPRNNWRIIPLANPDGAVKKTRTNAAGVDLNRNFPTKDWEAEALNYWKKESKSSARKFPGEKSASEPEVNCLMNQIQDFKPEFVISIHTPLNVLDFDGPKVKAPAYSYLPWKRLGNFPGSLGRYLWVEQSVPVLTTELKDKLPSEGNVFDQLQDVIGQLVQTDLK